MYSIILFLLFLLPFVIAPFGTSWFETPKVLLAELFIVVLVCLGILKKKFFRIDDIDRFVVYVLGIILGLTLFQLVFIHSSAVMWGSAYRLQGIVLIWLLIAFTYISVRVSTPFQFKLFIFALLAIHAVCAFFLDTTDNGRSIGTLGEPNSLAAYVIFLWPFAWMATSKKNRLSSTLRFCTIVLVLTIITLSGSRSGLVAFLVQAIVLALSTRISLRNAYGIGFILLLLSLFLPLLEFGSIYENRADIWKVSLKAGLEKPLLGWGFGNQEQAIHETAVALNNPVQYRVIDSSHNIILDWWVQGGILGFVTIVVLIGYTFVQLFIHNRSRELIVLLGLVACLLFNPVSVALLLPFWWLVAQGVKEASQI